VQANPNACWDWWGYHDLTNTYMTRTSSQMAAIRGMLTAITRGFQPTTPAPASGAVAPDGLVVSDVSDKAADLAWHAVTGVSTYRVYRATQLQGPFALAGSVAGPSFGDSGLTPARDDYWQVSSVVGTAESPRPTTVAQHTVKTPPPCANPGNCPVIPH
jgi:hypothetical protein